MKVESLAETSAPLGSGRPPDSKPTATTPALVSGLRRLDQWSPTAAFLVGGVLICCIGALGYLTGPQLSSSALYLIPILLVTRVAGFRAGILAAALAASIWLVADLNAEQGFDNQFIPYWNFIMRVTTFLITVGLVAAMGTLHSNLEDRVHERTGALESQIAENRKLETAILNLSDLERAAIGQDLHDGLCQQLVSAAFSANLLRQKLAQDPITGRVDADRIADMIDDAITQARNLARGLYPVRLEAEGLEMALRELVSGMSRRFEIPCIVECHTPVAPITPGSDIHLYRIAQEAVVNAGKHANASKIVVSLSSVNDTLTLIIRDYGTGIGKTMINPDGMGLRIMEYRARMIGANFHIQTPADGGTEVVCVLAP